MTRCERVIPSPIGSRIACSAPSKRAARCARPCSAAAPANPRKLSENSQGARSVRARRRLSVSNSVARSAFPWSRASSPSQWCAVDSTHLSPRSLCGKHALFVEPGGLIVVAPVCWLLRHLEQGVGNPSHISGLTEPRQTLFVGLVSSLTITEPVEHPPEDDEAPADHDVVVQLSSEREAFLDGRHCRAEIALGRGQESHAREGLRSRRSQSFVRRVRTLVRGEHSLQPASPFAEVAALSPEPDAQDSRQAKSERGVRLLLEAPGHCRSQVVVLTLQLLEPLGLRQPTELRLRPFHEAQEVLSMSPMQLGPSPLASSRSSPHSRIVSSIRKRGSPSGASIRRKRFFATSEVMPSRSSSRGASALQTVSAACSRQPPANTVSRRKRRCSC